MGISQQYGRWLSALLSLLLIFGVTLAGCGKGEQPDQKRNDDRPTIPARHKHFNMPESVKPAELTFQDPAVGEQMVRFDVAARKLADDTWTKHADAEYPYLDWNSGSGGYLHRYQAVWKSTGQNVAISTDLYNKPRAAYGFELSAMYILPSGWKADLGYGLSNGKNGSWQSFNLAFFHPQLWPAVSEEPTPGLVVGPFGPSFAARRKDEQFDYRFLVHSREGIATLKNDDIARYLTSADSFRQAALDELNRLEDQVRVRIQDESGFEIWTHGGSGAEPPQPAAVNPARGDKLPAAIKQSVLDQAIEDIGRRKKQVEEHHVEFHEATVAAFPPLLELLTSP